MRLGALLAVGVLAAVVPASAQEWRAGAQLGRISYNGALATWREEPAVVVGLSRIGFSDWLGLTAGLPLGEQKFWAAAGASRRLSVARKLGLYLDLSAHGFAQRAPDSLAGPLNPLPLPVPAESAAATGWFVRGAGAQAFLLFGARRGRVQLSRRAPVAPRRPARSLVRGPRRCCR
jgi:hypothetical protein